MVNIAADSISNFAIYYHAVIEEQEKRLEIHFKKLFILFCSNRKSSCFIYLIPGKVRADGAVQMVQTVVAALNYYYVHVQDAVIAVDRLAQKLR